MIRQPGWRFAGYLKSIGLCQIRSYLQYLAVQGSPTSSLGRSENQRYLTLSCTWLCPHCQGLYTTPSLNPELPHLDLGEAACGRNAFRQVSYSSSIFLGVSFPGVSLTASISWLPLRTPSDTSVRAGECGAHRFHRFHRGKKRKKETLSSCTSLSLPRIAFGSPYRLRCRLRGLLHTSQQRLCFATAPSRSCLFP